MDDKHSLTLKVGEAAKLLGISRGLAYQLAREGKLPVIRLGRRMLVPKKALEMLLSGQTFGSDAQQTDRKAG